jgi:hypothetical protein
MRFMRRHRFESWLFVAGIAVAVAFYAFHRNLVPAIGGGSSVIALLVAILYPPAVVGLVDVDMFSGSTWLVWTVECGVLNGIIYVVVGLAVRRLIRAVRRV